MGSGVKAPARQFMDVALMPFGRLRFRQVYTDLEITKVGSRCRL